VHFDLSDDQVALRDGMRALCTGRFGSERVRAGFDRSVHDELADAGLFSLRSDGFSWADVSVAFQELGRALVPGPLVWTHLADGVVDGIVTGVEQRGGGTAMLEHLESSDVVVVLGAEGIARIAPSDIDGAEPIEWPLDPLTPIHRVDVMPDGEMIADADAARAWRDGGALLTAAYSIGIAQACVDAAVAYSLERRQFDRPIGSFQAVKHILADMAVRSEVARAAVDAAAVALDESGGTAPVRPLSGARLLASEAALRNAKASMQVHGGMGFTWEVDVHLFLKRAWVLDTVFGTPAQHADALAATLA
jgi:alkylation response protein AidB-like acyl-CoA dehydrogenase